MDFNKLTLGDKIVGGAFIAFFISLFLPWFNISVDFGDFGDLGDFGGASADASGWDVDFFWSTFPFLLGLVMVAQIVIDRFTEVELPELPVTWGQVHLGLGGLAALLVVLKLLIGESGGTGVEVSRSYGLILAALAAIALAVGGYFKMQEDGAGVSGGGASAPPEAF